ncbi:hypothetical protein HK105_200940 [Polyrhizophydium stewartii]|uniref:DSBA-like thioredoxin domain-containing protein n=1 Tax=Polyrhizophydium stewartii TaxID=2732419 RepID=A0ABR4NID7_9FUNG
MPSDGPAARRASSSSSSPGTVVFYFDVVCPWAYIGSVRLQALAQRFPAVEFEYKPVLLGGIYELTKAPQGKDGSATQAMAAAKQRLHVQDLERTVARAGVRLSMHPSHPVRSVSAVRLIYLCATMADRVVLANALFRAYWVDNVDISDHAVLLRVAAASGARFRAPAAGAGGDIAKTVAASELTAQVFGDPALAQMLRDATQEAVDRGAPGVPSFWVSRSMIGASGVESGPALYHGQDRLHFVESALAGVSVAKRQLADVGSGLVVHKRRLTFFWDFSSPWSYLGWIRVHKMSKVWGDNVTIEHVPVLVGALFREIGTPVVPSLATSPAKAAYMSKDLQDWVDYWNDLDRDGDPIVFDMPDFFPVRSVLPLRVAIAHPEVAHLFFVSAWSRRINIGDAAVLTKLLDDNGHDGRAMVAEAASEPIKSRLHANTQRAVALGCCGVPTFQVDGGPLLWGQDHLDVVVDELHGWVDPVSRHDAKIGDAEGVAAALKEIEAIVAARTSKHISRVKIERAFHQFLAGPGGASTAALQDEFGIKIHIAPFDFSHTTDKDVDDIVLMGGRSAVLAAQISSSSPGTVVFYFDVVCPWAYIGSVRLQVLAQRFPAVEFEYKPVLLGGIYELTKAPQGKDGSATQAMAAAKQRLHVQDLERTVARAGVRLSMHPSHPVRSVSAVRLIYLCATMADRVVLANALFRAYWVDNVDISDHAVLLRVAAASGARFRAPAAGAGGDIAKTVAASELTAQVFGDPALAQMLRDATQEAVDRGAPGVPSFWVSRSMIGASGVESGPALYHGQDRMHFVESALAGVSVAKRQLADVGSGLVVHKRRLTFFWDFSSYWSFLGWMRVHKMSKVWGDNVTIESVPIVVGSLFKTIGTPVVPLFTFSKARAAREMKDLQDWVDYWNDLDRDGDPIVFDMPDFFPVRSVLPLRVAIAHPEVAHLFFVSAWSRRINIGDAAVLTKLLDDNGYGGRAMVAEAASEPIKSRLHANTQRAVALGCCGVPTFQVDGGPLLWGQDHLDVVVDELHGWVDPVSRHDAKM